MKYGLKVDKDGIPDYTRVRRFTNARWKMVENTSESGWVQFPWRRVFISFCEADRSLMSILFEEVYKCELLNPITVESNRKGGNELAELVMEEISDCYYFIPIISKNSLNNQWVNQEIGCAKGLKKRICPIVEKPFMGKLKGFIHNQLQLPYCFTLQDKKVSDLDKTHFTRLCRLLVSDINNELIEKYGIINEE